VNGDGGWKREAGRQKREAGSRTYSRNARIQSIHPLGLGSKREDRRLKTEEYIGVTEPI